MSTESVSASIVLFNSPFVGILDLVHQLTAQGVSRIYIVDNSDLDFEALGTTALPAQCEYIRSSRNLGYGRGHNVAMERAYERFEYHVVCNPDVYLRPDVIEVLHRYMESHLDVGIAMPKLLNIDGSVQHCCRRSPVLWDYLSQVLVPNVGALRRWRLEMRDHDYDSEMEVPCLSGCFMFTRLSSMQLIGGFDPGFFLYFEDFDISMRASQVGRTRYVPWVSIIHERQSGHRRSWRLKWLFLRSALRYFNRWGYFASRATQRTTT